MNLSFLAERLFGQHLFSDFAFPFRLGSLSLKFRPFSYDPVAIYTILFRHIYGTPPSKCSVVDIGAHIGVYSLFCASRGTPKVLAFEPELRNFRLLQDNVMANGLGGTIQARNLAVWSKDQRKTLFTSRGSAFHSFFSASRQPSRGQTVDCVDINSVLEPLTGSVVLKVDAEGSEYEIITHIAERNLSKIKTIVLEYHTASPALQGLFPVLTNWLGVRKFRMAIDTRNRILHAFAPYPRHSGVDRMCPAYNFHC